MLVCQREARTEEGKECVKGMEAKRKAGGTVGEKLRHSKWGP